MNPSDHFSQSYAEARTKFLGAARAAGCELGQQLHPLKGRDGEALAIDVARLGPADAAAMLVISSGCHGLEGFAGSGVQLALLHDAAFLRSVRESGIALLLVHGVNPWGFSWWERWTHENVDLNRNFVDFSRPEALPANPGYDELADAIVPASLDAPEADAKLWEYFHLHGAHAFREAATNGQYRHTDGMYYGGDAPTWSRQAMQALVREQAARCTDLVWIDLHTAIGDCGDAVLMAPESADTAAVARARAWWGEKVAITGEAESGSTAIVGTMLDAVAAMCPQARVTGLLVEFGTVPGEQTFMAQRANQVLLNGAAADAAQRDAIKRRVRDVFYVDTDAWKQAVATRGCAVAVQALRGLAGR